MTFFAKQTNKQTNKLFKVILYALLCLWVLSCSTPPPVQTLKTAQSSSSKSANTSAFRIQSTEEGQLCLNNYNAGNQDGYVFIEARHRFAGTQEWYHLNPALSSAGLILQKQADDTYLVTYLKAEAYSGPYGYHLNLFQTPATLPGPITPGTTVTVPFSTGATMAEYSWGDSTSTTFDISGSLQLSFSTTGVSATVTNGTGTMLVSGHYHSTGQPKYDEAQVTRMSGTLEFPAPSWSPCPSVKLTAAPEIISPANEDGQFDTANFHVKSTTGEPWTLSVAGNLPGPPDEDGYPTAGAPCTWSVTGSEPETDIGWNGTCQGSPMVDGSYTATLKSGEMEDTASIGIDNTPPKISRPEVTTTAAGDVEISYLIEDPVVNNMSSGLDPNISTNLSETSSYPNFIDILIESLNQQASRVTFKGSFPIQGEPPEFSEMLSLFEEQTGDFSTQAIRDRSQIVPKDKVANQSSKKICEHPGPKREFPYNPPYDPPFQSCSSPNNSPIQLLTVLDNDKTGPDLTFVFGPSKTLNHKDGSLKKFRESTIYKNMFIQRNFFDTNLTVSSNNKNLQLRGCGAKVRPGDNTTILENLFKLDGVTFFHPGGSDSANPSINNLIDYLFHSGARNSFETAFVAVAVNLHAAYNKAKRGAKNILVEFKYNNQKFMNVYLNLNANGVWEITCQPK